jgi:hypothetical protein
MAAAKAGVEGEDVHTNNGEEKRERAEDAVAESEYPVAQRGTEPGPASMRTGGCGFWGEAATARTVAVSAVPDTDWSSPRRTPAERLSASDALGKPNPSGTDSRRAERQTHTKVGDPSEEEI